MRSASTRRIILDVLNDGMPHTTREIVARNLGEKAAYQGLFRCWASGLILRTRKPMVEYEKVFRGRLGNRSHTRSYHLYLLKPAGKDRVLVKGLEFVSYSKEHLDVRGGGSLSKAKMILNFLKENSGQAWFSKEIVDALKSKGVKPHDVMSSIRRFERKGLVYVRGYHSEIGKKPFAEGFLSVWLDPSKPRHMELDEAIKMTNLALERKGCRIPIIQRVQRLRDIVHEALRLGEIVSLTYIQSVLNCTTDELDDCMSRVSPDLSDACIQVRN